MYPSNYRVKENNTIDANGLKFDGVAFYIPDPKKTNFGKILDEGITLGVQDLKTQSFVDELDHYYYQGGVNVPKTPNTKLDGVDASRADWKHSGGYAPENTAALFAIKGNKSYLFSLSTSYENEEVLIKNFNQILSTFQFID